MTSGENKDLATAAPVTPTKTRTDENFPVASLLIPAKLRPHVHFFYLCVRAADDIADHPTMSPDDKLAGLKQFDEALLGNGTPTSLTEPAFAHRESAVETGVTVDHARHLLQAFMMDATKKRYRNWSELINYCRYSAAPVGRYLLDLHGDTGEAKPQTDALCIALQILNHLQDCQDDYRNLDRVYIPEDFMRAEGTSVGDLDAAALTPAMRKVLDQVLERTAGLVADSAAGPAKIVNRGLRMETAVIIAIARRLTEKLMRHDPIARRVQLSKFETALCGIRGVLSGGLGR